MTTGKKVLIGILVALGVLVVIGIVIGSYLVGTYNKIVTSDQEVKSAWAQVNNQLQRRYDLIPNLVETVKGYAKHESDVFIKVTEARAKVGGAQTVSEKIAANNELSGALSRLLVVVENYPQLKANENFIRLQDELAGTENRIAVERMRYNDQVKYFNQRVKRFPTNLIAGMFSFKEAAFFEVPAQAMTAPKVKF